MNTSTQYTEAYVINPDGTRTAAPVTYTAHRSARTGRPQQPGFDGFANTGANPFAQTADTAYAQGTFAPQPGLHLGRRIAGLAIAAIGVPLLILPGPGLAMIAVGLGMALMP